MPARLESWRTRLLIPAADLRAALLLAWFALSAVLGAAAAAALAAPEEAVLEAAARCEAPGGHRRACSLCGMTRSFLALRKGDVERARRANAAGLVLFPSIALNEVLAAFVWICRMRRGRKERIRPAAAVGNPGP